MSTGKVATGVIVGVAVGAILGILFAPDKGSETRKKMAQKGNDFLAQIKERFSQMTDEISEEIETQLPEKLT